MLHSVATHHSSISCKGCSAALLLSGLLGDRQRDLTSLHSFVVKPLISFGFVVDTFACFNTTDAALPSWWPNAQHHFEHFTGATRMVVQTERLASCWTHAAASRKMFDLYVYCRPDMLWWDSLQLPSLDSIVLRAREIALAKGEHIFQQQVSIPCRTHTIFPGSIKRADEEAVPDDCFIVDDQLALVPGRFAEAFFNASSSSGRSKHCAKGDADTMKGCNAKLPIAMLPATRSTEKALTDRIQQHCIPTLIYPFNVSLGIKRPNAPNARPGGPGELRTVNPKDVWNNIQCASVPMKARSRNG